VAKRAKLAQLTVLHVPAILFVELVTQGMDFKALYARPAQPELISMVKFVQLVQIVVQHVQVVLCARVAREP